MKEIWNVQTYVSQQSKRSVLQDSEKNYMESVFREGESDEVTIR